MESSQTQENRSPKTEGKGVGQLEAETSVEEVGGVALNDRRSEFIAQAKWQQIANQSPLAQKGHALQRMANQQTPSVAPVRNSITTMQRQVMQRQLGDLDKDRLRKYMQEVYYSNPNIDPTIPFQVLVFNYLVANYDHADEAIENIPSAEVAILFSAKPIDDQGNPLPEPPPVAVKPPEAAEEKESKQEKMEDEDLFGLDDDLDDAFAQVDFVRMVYDAAKYKTIGEMLRAVSNKQNPRKYGEIRQAAEIALRALGDKIRGQEAPLEVLTSASSYVVQFLKHNDSAIEISLDKGRPNKKSLEEEQKKLMWAQVNEIKKLAGLEFRRPDGVLRASTAVVRKDDSRGATHELGTFNQTITGLKGSAEGEAANTMSASIALNEIYRLSFKNAFVAGHLVTRKAAGKANNLNLTPLTGYFNQGRIRTPEATAEKLMRENKVMLYSATANYGRNSNDGSSVNFAHEDLALIPTSITIKIEERGLKLGGDPTDIRDWTVATKTPFNAPVPINLKQVTADLLVHKD